jgi:CRP-like cAMP-binding protein
MGVGKCRVSKATLAGEGKCNAVTESKDKDFDYRAFLPKQDGGTISTYQNGQIIYRQGDPADALYYIVSGTVKVTYISEFGKEAVIAILGAGDFFGEGCVNGNSREARRSQPRVPARLYD